MKKLIGLISIFVCCLFAVFEAFSGHSGMAHIVSGVGGSLLAMPPAVTLQTQKIVFLRSLKEEYDVIENWMQEAEDLSAFVSEGQTLQFPEGGDDPAVYKNRTTDVDSVEPTEDVHKVELDVYDSQNYKVRNIYLHALPFEKLQYYTRKSADAIIKQEIMDAAFAYAPQASGSKKIIIPTTGTIRSGYKSMTLEDIIVLARACDNAQFPEGRNLVLPSDMWWDLVNNNAILKGQLERQTNTGVIKPNVVEYYGFKIHKSLGNKLGVAYDLGSNEKAPQGTAIGGDVVPAALLFCKNQVFRAGGSMEMFYQDKSTNTAGRAYEFGFQHRFKADFQMNAQRYSGLVYMALDDNGPIDLNTEFLAKAALTGGTNMISSVDDKVATVTVQYPASIDSVLEDYVADAHIEVDEAMPSGTTVLIKYGGNAVGTATLAADTSEVYLSQLIKLAAPTATVRTSITGHEGRTDVWELTITPPASYEANVVVKSQISKNAITFGNAQTLATTSFDLDITI